MPVSVQPRLTFTLNWDDSAHYGTLMVGEDPGIINTIKITGSGFANNSKIELYSGSTIFTDLAETHEYFYGTANASGTELTASFLAKFGGSSAALPLFSGTFLVLRRDKHGHEHGDHGHEKDDDDGGQMASLEGEGGDRDKFKTVRLKLMVAPSGGMVTVTTTVTNYPSGEQPFGYCRVLEVPEEPSPP